MRRPQALQSRAIGRGDCHSGRRVLRIGRRTPARLLHRRRLSSLGRRHHRAYKTVNGVEGRGGSIDGPGPVIGGGMLFVNSGYAAGGGMPGNVLLAFSVDGKMN